MFSAAAPWRIHSILIAVLLLSLAAANSKASQEMLPAALSITAPNASGVVLAEMDEFATNVLGDPWDMNQASDLAFYRSESGMTNSVFNSGIYSALMADRDGSGIERITLLTSGAQDNAAMRIGKIGYNYPINADRYRYLTYRLYKSNPECNNGGLIIWYADDSYSTNAAGISNSFPVTPGASSPCSGWFTIVLDLATIGLQAGSKTWSGTIREIMIKPFAGGGTGLPLATVKLDYARLTSANPLTARPFTIRWTGDGTGGDVTLYASPGNRTLDDDDFLIAAGQDPAGGSYRFETGVLPAGEYYIAAENSTGIAWSDGSLIINSPPQTIITAPSMSSGQDYAETEIGNAWDMDDANDLNDELPPGWDPCVVNENYSDGLYRADLAPACPPNEPGSDSMLIIGHLNPPGPDPIIDTHTYRYLSFRFFHSGEQNVGEGWVARFGWWQKQKTGVTEATVMSRDIIIYEGWNTYKVDLWAADVVDETNPSGTPWRDSAPNRLRLDPSELLFNHFPAWIAIDWLRLTAMDEVQAGDVYAVRYSVDRDQAVNLAFYYDTDRNPNNGRTLIGLSLMGSNDNTRILDKRVYLPIIFGSGSSSMGNNAMEQFYWNTAGVLPGTYYVCINSTDAYNETYRCSEAPLRVR
jgi:hypothetical protein